MVRLYLSKLLASVCSFALQFQPKTAPPRVGYTLGEVMVLEHVLDLQVFYSHFIATKKNAMRRLKLEILALIRYPFMGTGDNLRFGMLRYATQELGCKESGVMLTRR